MYRAPSPSMRRWSVTAVLNSFICTIVATAGVFLVVVLFSLRRRPERRSTSKLSPPRHHGSSDHARSGDGYSPVASTEQRRNEHDTCVSSRSASSQSRSAGLREVTLLSREEAFGWADAFPTPTRRYSLKGVSFGGSGIFFWWELGCVLWLLQHVDVDSCPFYGASGGALAATLTACRVDPFEAFDLAYRLSIDNGICYVGLLGVWGELIRIWLDELLPSNAAEICRHRVGVVVTTLPGLRPEAISDFDSRESLISANMASVHIPFVSDGRPGKKFRDLDCIDGSFHDCLSGSNSDLLTRNGNSLLFDYVDDENLNYKRMDFLTLKKPSEVVFMIQQGYAYAERLSETEAFQRALATEPLRPAALLQSTTIP